MTLSLTPVDPANPGHLDAYCRVVDAVREQAWPGWRQLNPRLIRLMIEHPFPYADGVYLLGWHEGEPVAKVNLEIFARENTDAILADVWVIPAARRRGFGMQLWEHVCRIAADLGRKRILAITSWDLPEAPARDMSGVAFAESLGFQPSLIDVARRLELSTVDESVLDTMSRPAAGYRIVRWIDAAPEEYLEDLAYLDSRLHADAPHGDLDWEPPKPDAERVRLTQIISARRGRRSYHTAAVHEASGRLVAWTTITLEDSIDWNAFQQVTVVDPDHRGHRLGALIKAENLRYLRTHEPAITTIDTFNAHSNGYMIAINEQMGFRPLYAWQNWQREI
jgi:GNAT superfamily N-acetyltransferase